MASSEIEFLALPAKAHNADISRGKDSLPSFHTYTPEAMDSSTLRQRPGPGHDSDGSNDGELGSTGETLTPSSSRQSSVGRDSFFDTVRRRLSQSRQRIAATTEAADDEQQKIDYGYDRFVKGRPADATKFPRGFPRLAAWTSDEDDRSIHRRFKYMHNRLLHKLEVQLTELEYDLADLDEADALKEAQATKDGRLEGPEFRLKSTQHEDSWDDAQEVLFERMTEKVMIYNKLFFAQTKYGLLSPASERSHLYFYNLTGYCDFNGRTRDFALHKDDFVSTVSTHSSWAHLWIKDIVHKNKYKFLNRIFQKLLRPVSVMRNEEDPPIDYFDNDAFDRLATAILVTLCVSILLIPAFLLFLLPMTHFSMAITSSVFIAVCSFFISSTTTADPYKVFVGTATYSALVIMFLGNIGASEAKA